MKTLISMVALAAASLLVAVPALAQTTTPSSDPTKKPSTGAGTDSTTPSQSPSTPGSATTSDAMKSTGKAGRMGAGMGKEHVRAVQEALKGKGMDPGPVDGVMGPKTQTALRDFQKQEGLKTTGRLDAETMGKLGVEARAGAAAGAPPAASPRGDASTGSGAAGAGSTPSSGSSSSGSSPTTTTPGAKK